MIENKVNDSVIVVATENALGKVLRSHRKSREKVFILFLSKWDKCCDDLINNTLEKYKKKSKVYLVDSWTCAKAFVTYQSYFGVITKAPTLVTLSPGPPRVDEYLPNIYRTLDVG
tara:strand:+ start:842 stop:1186 length:345 start_codon:yes stop_codon:yes gene_type:complete